MNPIRSVLLAVALLIALPQTLQAQDADALLAEGKQAFREGRYEAAAQAFERAAEVDPDNAEAFYLAARVYFETPIQDRKRAEKNLDKALDLDPDNVQYLVAQLQQLRTEHWSFLVERIRETRRVELAEKILKIDSTNAFAHEEIGTVYIRDFWRYRNAVMLPLYALEFAAAENVVSYEDLADNIAPTIGFNPAAGDQTGGSFTDPHQVFLNDRFDIETLEAQGTPVRDLSWRAQKAYEHAVGHLNKALEADPRRRSVYDHLMEIYALKGEYQEALEMLQQMYRFYPEDPGLWRYLGFAHYHAGNLEAADRSFETAFQFMPEDEAQAYQDVSYLLTSNEQQSYAEDPVAFASRFWMSKDPRYLTPYNERHLEHYARLTYADLLYGAPDIDRRGWETQRGLILVRYGRPLADVMIIPDDESINEEEMLTAALNLPTEIEGFGIFTPRSVEDDADPASGVAFVDDPNHVRQTSDRFFDEMNTFNIWEYGGFRFVFEDPFRNGEFRLFSPSASAVAAGVNPWINDYEIRTKEIFRRLPEQYQYETPGRQIELPYVTAAFKGEGGKTDLYVHYAVPITSFSRDQDMLEITANTGTFLVGENRDILVERRRTIYGLPTDQIVTHKEVNLWVDTQTMEAPPGKHELSVEFETASGGTIAVQRREVEVPDFSTDRLALSDLMLAYRVEETAGDEPLSPHEVVRHGLSIQPAPWTVFSTDQPIYLYFETYDLARGDDGQTDYQVDILLVPKQEAKGIARLFQGITGRKRGVAVSFSGTGSSPDEGTYQILDAAGQDPGLYSLVVRVRDNIARRTVESEQDLFLD